MTKTIQTTTCALALAALAACATNPATGQRQLSLVSESQEIAMGQSAAADVRRTLGLVENRALQSYIAATGLALARTSERPRLPWSFQAVDDPTPNAFALPGGFIFITRGMLNLMDSEAELASVLGHEIGHVTARHSVTAISRQQLAQLGLGLGGIFFPEVQPFGQAIGAGLELLFLKHGRDAERQADELGMRYAVSRNYDAEEGIDVFESLQRTGDEQRSALPSWLSTHPSPAERIATMRQRVNAQGAPSGEIVDRAEYLNHLDGLVYGDNPRQGFFRDGVFYHPDLRFRFSVPQGWRTQNLSQAVQAMSPQQDAAIVLTLSGTSNPEAAVRRMAQSEGVRILQSSSQRINGLPAALTAFDAATQGGVVRGLVAHIAHRGVVYELIGYAPVERFAGRRSVIERTLGSFTSVSDPAILNVQPRRIDIVRLPRAMTLSEFANRYASSVPIDELALINQAANASTWFAAGSLMKRVVGSAR